jgi:hypothetical protein
VLLQAGASVVPVISCRLCIPLLVGLINQLSSLRAMGWYVLQEGL